MVSDFVSLFLCLFVCLFVLVQIITEFNKTSMGFEDCVWALSVNIFKYGITNYILQWPLEFYVSLKDLDLCLTVRSF